VVVRNDLAEVAQIEPAAAEEAEQSNALAEGPSERM